MDAERGRQKGVWVLAWVFFWLVGKVAAGGRARAREEKEQRGKGNVKAAPGRQARRTDRTPKDSQEWTGRGREVPLAHGWEALAARYLLSRGEGGQGS